MRYNWVMKKKQHKMIKNIMCWQCSVCRKWKSGVYFYNDSRTSNGLKSQCVKCHTRNSVKTRDKINARRINREYARRARKANPENFREKERFAAQKRVKGPAYKAYQILHKAVKTGKIQKPLRCEECNKKYKLSAHHEDYTKPLEVEWLCYECHGRRSWKD